MRLKSLESVVSKFEECWNEYQDYKKMVPSYGAVIFSKGFNKILFGKALVGIRGIVVYQSEQKIEEEGVSMLDFTKGKADEGESDIDCAVREINEEVGFNVRPYINEDHFIKVETI